MTNHHHFIRTLWSSTTAGAKQRKWKAKVIVGSLAVVAVSGGVVYGEYRRLDRAVHFKPDSVVPNPSGSTYIYLKPLSNHDDLVAQMKTKVQYNINAVGQMIKEHDTTGLSSVLDIFKEKHLWNDPLELLRKTRSDDQKIRLLAVKTLSKKHSWHDHEYQMIAQACDQRTLIGLGRSYNVDKRFFLPPPAFKETKESIEEKFRDFLSSLPKSNVDRCTEYFTGIAMRESNLAKVEDQTGTFCFGCNQLSYFTALSKVPQESMQSLYLLALVSHSEVRSHCKEIVRLGGLQLLMEIYQSQAKSPKVNCYLAQIIANIAVCDELHESIVKSGWVTVLAQWKKSKFTELASQAARALANMDQDDQEGKYNNGVNIIHPLGRYSQAIHADVVFVHGLMGGAFYTWRQGQEDQNKETFQPLADRALTTPMNGVNDDQTDVDVGRIQFSRFSDCWPKSWLAKDCPHIRILTVSYDTRITEWASKCPYDTEKRSLAQRSGEIIRKLKEAGLGKRPIIWVTHSMGGLLVKQMLLDAYNEDDLAPIADNTNGIIFYSTPHHGASLATYTQQAKYLLFPSVEVSELATGSPYLKSLHGKFRAFARAHNVKVLSIGETETTNIGMGIKTLVVPKESSNAGIGEFYELPISHLNICKPHSRTSLLYRMTFKFIHDNLHQSFREQFTEKLTDNVDVNDNSDEMFIPFGMSFGD